MHGTEPLWDEAAALVEAAFGLHFPPHARSQLQRGFNAAARDLGLGDGRRCAQRLLAAPRDRAGLGALAQRLTVGETYFYRDPWMLEALSQAVLAPLVDARRRADRRLRLWSAGCSSGEETYTLAGLVLRLLPEPEGWDVEIVGSDINADALRRARAAVYGRRALRNAPGWFVSAYMEPLADDSYRVRPALRRIARFAQANLVDPDGDTAPVPGEVDVIVCRNALMYLSAAQAALAVGRLRDHLPPGGWLIVSDTELGARDWPGFDPVQAGQVTLLRKRADAGRGARPAPAAACLPTAAAPAAMPVDALGARPAAATAAVPTIASAAPTTAPAAAHTAAPTVPPAATPGAPSADANASTQPAGPTAPPDALARRIERLADAGRFDQALHLAARALDAHPRDAQLHYLRGIVLRELGQPAPARDALHDALALDAGFVLAHFALGDLARETAAPAESRRHYALARRLLARLPPDAVLRGSARLTAGQLGQVLAMVNAAQPA